MINSAQRLAITHVTVVDVINGRSLPDHTVLITGDRIDRVGPADRIPVPEGFRVVDGTGRHLIPGLADMHLHDSGDERIDPPLLIANGVTTVRQMWGTPYLHEWRRRSDSGELVGPRWVIASPIVDGRPSLWEDAPVEQEYLAVGTEDEARAAVRRVKGEGADFVKVYSRLSPDALRAIADEAARLDIPFAGHLPDAVSLEAAIDLGQRSFEHLHRFGPETSRSFEALQAAMARVEPDWSPKYGSWFQQVGRIEWDAANTHSAHRAARLFDRLAAAGAAVCPTVVLHRVLERPDSVDPRDRRLDYLPGEMKSFYEYIVDGFYSGHRTPEEGFQHRVLFQWRLEVVASLEAAGVRLLAGTDTMTGYVFPGFSLHDELGLFVAAGLTPARALQTATIEPARYLGRDHRQGSVDEGKVADLVLLNADPLADIANTQAIRAVISRGRLYDRDALDGLLDGVRTAAAETPVPQGA
ncbi:amidohydrolase family protein [Microlunatus parietis]|uniref:Imidazolonepropionase-like amidohydrolase n=1 Tax=Microlunatus parietis TaxID=682979 RepID=A0A7Y9I4V8_9ACTN|nr:amidohydrolase family protein [Microlunatus parietis]NYE70327.1 imidazolonepropionase-like amidohydrolase [Microlunatus parietis]